MRKIDENDLIAYHLEELPPLRKRRVRAALERDTMLAAESEEIAETLREFRGGTASVVDAAMLERSWAKVRPSLVVLEPKGARSWRWIWMLGAGVAMALVIFQLPRHVGTKIGGAASVENTSTARPVAGVNEAPVIAELGAAHVKASKWNEKPGPLTAEPADEVGMSAHLDAAERLLTVVSHQDGPLTAETRGEVHQLLLRNAVYQQRAQENGDLATAGVMDDLGRVLVSLDAAPPETASSADSFRLEMNVGGVLFDLRILHHNSHDGRE